MSANPTAAGHATPPPALTAWCAQAFGPGCQFSERSHAVSTCRVWQVRDRSGATVAYAKHYRHGRGYRQECQATAAWAAALAPHAPRLLAQDLGGEPLLVLSPVPGRPSAPGELTVAHFRSAGRLLRRLHDLPFVDRDPLSPAEALGRRWTAWRARARDLLSDALLARVDAAVPVAAGLLPNRRVPCHRDFTARNWLLDDEDPDFLGVIDFEHARADCWQRDLVRLWSDVFRHQPALAAALLDGYGRRLSADDRRLLDILAAVEGVTTVAWAREHEDAEFEIRGREICDHYLRKLPR